ncbi:MAG: hypothetical protein IRZ32_17110 [Solirubrobacteraceae bacterium]|nr:hypothetical protein [Solirubrobacteraceae bacterium]
MTPSSREERTHWRARDDAEVFVALERARRLCARLRDLPDGPPPGPDAFAAAEARLGLAGFVASEHLDAGQREELRREAAAIAPPRSPERQADRVRALAAAAGRLAHGTQDAEVCEELHLAGLHIDDALRVLGMPAPGPRLAWSGW